MFDLETDSIWMTQATNCGSTPAALNNVQDLSVVTGACGLTEGVDATSSTLIPSSGAESGEFVAVPTSSSLGPQASGAASQDSTTPELGGSTRCRPETGFIWGMGVMVALQLFLAS